MKALSCLARGGLTFIFFFSASNTVEHTKRVIRVVAGACQFFTRAGCSSNLLPSPYMTFSKTSGSFLARVLSVNFFLLTLIEFPVNLTVYCARRMRLFKRGMINTIHRVVLNSITRC